MFHVFFCMNFLSDENEFFLRQGPYSDMFGLFKAIYFLKKEDDEKVRGVICEGSDQACILMLFGC